MKQTNNKEIVNEVTTKDTKQIVLKRMLILCWIVLAICFVIKIFGGNFFNVFTNNTKFIKFCNYVQNSFWYYIVGFIFYYIGNMILWLSMKRKLKASKTDAIVLSCLIIIIYVIQYLLQSIGWLYISLITSTIRFIIIPLFVFRISWKNVLIVNIFDICFQLISSFIKNINVSSTIANSVVVGIIFMIDYYIMIVLLYLYSYYTNKHKEDDMGFFGSWFLSKEEKQRKAYEKATRKNNKVQENNENK